MEADAPATFDHTPTVKVRTHTNVTKQAKVSEKKLRNIAELAKADAAAVERIIGGDSTIRDEKTKVNQAARAAVAQREVTVPDGPDAGTA